MGRLLSFRLVAVLLGSALVFAGPFTEIAAAPAAPAAVVEVASPEPIDIEGLLAQRDAQLQRRSAAVEVRLAGLAAIERERILQLGYDPETATTPQEIARQMMANRYSWGDDEFACYDRIITQESRWQWDADNPRSSAYGIPQALPGSKMASAGADWRTNPATQITWGLGYVKQRYGTPCKALSFKRGHGWY